MLTRVSATLEPETAAIVERTIGCAIDVHRILGPGFSEVIYQEALALELDRQRLPFAREVEVPIFYREQQIKAHRLDLVVANRVLVELKAVERLERVHYAQVVAYLKSSRLRVGLLMNFSGPRLKSGLHRIVL